MEVHLTIAQHSGDIGDIVYSIPTLRLLGVTHLHLNISRYLHTKMDIHTSSFIKPLLESEGFEVTISPGKPPQFDIDMDLARTTKQNLGTQHLGLAFAKPQGVSPDFTKAWLTCPNPLKLADIIINHSERYHNPAMPWSRIIEACLQRGWTVGYVGRECEYATFNTKYPIPYFKVEDGLHLKRVIAGARCFLGNQSAPFAIAEGLKVPRFLEVCTWTPNSMPQDVSGFPFKGASDSDRVLEILTKTL